MNRYDRNRVASGLNYADQRLASRNRKPSPLASKMLALYRRACQQYIDCDDVGWNSETSKIELLTQIRDFEKDIADRSWLRTVPSKYRSELQDALIKLRQRNYYAQYGGYSKETCVQIRNIAKSSNLESRSHLSTEFDWVQINRKIDEEWQSFQKDDIKEWEKYPTIQSVHEVCNQAGLNFDNAILAIHTYAKRNELVHSSWKYLLEQQKWDELKQLLFADYNELPSVIPETRPGELNFVRSLILEYIERWWDINDPKNIQSWTTKSSGEGEDRVTHLKRDAEKIRMPSHAIQIEESSREVVRLAMAREEKKLEIYKQAEEYTRTVTTSPSEDTVDTNDTKFPVPGFVLSPKKGKKKKKASVRVQEDAITRRAEAWKYLKTKRHGLSEDVQAYNRLRLEADNMKNKVISVQSSINSALLDFHERFDGQDENAGQGQGSGVVDQSGHEQIIPLRQRHKDL